MNYLDTLNPQQKAAVLNTEGPLLILAGAGSGKTRVLTCRIAYLVEQGVAPWKILAITFTNKAAREMKERVENLVGEGAEDIWVSTFHACCARILRRDIEKIGYKRQFTIYDEDDKAKVIKSVIQELKLNDKEYSVKGIRGMISDAKNRLLSPREWLEEAGIDEHNENLMRAYRRYEEQLFGNDALDFDDLLVKTLKLLVENPPVLDYYRDKFEYILVDEYQDTNKAQYELIRLLAGERHNLCVVGDDDQSIYGWRGADIRNILDFEKDFPETAVIKLEQNYRSTGNILDAANQVIAHNRGRKEKVLWTDAETGEKLSLYHASDEREEANFIARMTQKLNKQGTRLGETAVLYRTNGQARVIEEAFVREGIPSKVYGAMRFYDRKEVKDILAYMRVLVNPDDNISARRVINEPKRGIGDSTVEKLATFADEQAGGSLMAACILCLDENPGLSARAYKLIREFASLMQQLTEDMYSLPITEFVEKILERTGYIAQLEAINDDESKERIENIREFQSAVTEFCEKEPDGDIEQFLENAALMSDTDNMGETTGAVTLTTLHSAKGLEFDVVFLAGMEESVFPTYRALMDEQEMEEERRLAYVGITRARKRLFMSHARSRMLYNSRTSNQISRFVDEIPRRLISEGSARTDPGRLSRPYGRREGEPSAPYYSYNSPARTVNSGGMKTPERKMPDIPGIVNASTWAAPKRETAKVQLFKKGDRVNHGIFGKGTVVELTCENGVNKVTIEFDSGSKKRFSADIAPIRKI